MPGTLGRHRRLLVFCMCLSNYSRGNGDVDDSAFYQEHLDEDENKLTQTQVRSIHTLLDQNQDGKLSLQELMTFSDRMGKSMADHRAEEMMQDVDTSKDGTISLNEHLTDLRANHMVLDGIQDKEDEQTEVLRFKAADANGDGKLDASELPSLYFPETNGEVFKLSVNRQMQKKDTNNDGRLTAAEFWEEDNLSSDHKSEFEQLDANRDGSLDANELEAWSSGRFHTELAMKALINAGDGNNDQEITVDELTKASSDNALAPEARQHLIQWAAHLEI